jgi:nucleoside-diphosphate-sugar epimerase
MELKNKTLLITGIGDFVGLRTAEMALDRGIKVRGLEPDPKKAKAAEALDVPVTIGSTTDLETAKQACCGADLILHTESIIDPGEAIDRLRQVNVGGTSNIVKAAKEARVKTFLLLSSVVVYGFKCSKLVTEESPVRAKKNPFGQTLIEAELEALKYNEPPSFGVTVIRAGDIYGPGAETWILQPLQLMQKNFFALANADRSKIDRVYIDNLIDGLFLAAEKKSYGQIFNITDGSETSNRQFYSLLAELAGEPEPVSAPVFAIKAAAKTAGKKMGISPEAIDFMNRSHTCSIEKASRLLGYQPRIDLEEGMTKTANWLREQNYIKSISTKGAK